MGKSLTDAKIRTARPREKAYRLFDGGGLYLEVSPSGGRLWRYKYRYAGTEKRLALGIYPEVGLSDARARRAEAWLTLEAGRDPLAERKADKLARVRVAKATAQTFKAVAERWYAEAMRGRSGSHRANVESRLTRHIYPWLGAKPVDAVAVDDVRATINRIAETAPEVARRMLQVCGQVFRYAIAHGLAENNPAATLRGLVKPPPIRHHASLTDPRAVGGLLLAIDGYQGEFSTRCALRLAPLVFVRPGELRRAEWAEFNLEAKEWRIPADKMKAREPHIVPLSRQALAILEALRPVTGHGQFLFPAVRHHSRPMSENTVNAALRAMGYTREQMTGHGFRSIASTLLNEQGWNRDAIERQLAHGERNRVRAAYNHTDHMKLRRKMMQAWADYLDRLRAQAKAGNVVEFKRKA